jgi:hypothetical protein
MYHFAIVALLGLATLKFVDLLEEQVPQTEKYRGFLRLAIGVLAAVAIDYSLFDHYAVAVREDWMGTVGTGLMIGSLATVWRAAFSWLGAIADDGSEAKHSHRGRPRVAA